MITAWLLPLLAGALGWYLHGPTVGAGLLVLQVVGVISVNYLYLVSLAGREEKDFSVGKTFEALRFIQLSVFALVVLLAAVLTVV